MCIGHNEVVLSNTSSELKHSWIAVAHSDDLGDSPLQVWVLGEPWVVARLGDTMRAFVDRCPHRLAPLSAGTVVNDELQCGYHGWRFATDGSVTAIPALGSHATLPPRACLTPAAHVADHLGLIWLAIHEPLAPLPQLPGWNEGGFVSARCATVRTPVSALQLIDNFMDAAHFPFVHPKSFGVEDAFEVANDDVVTDGWTVHSTFSAPYQNHDDPRVATGEHPLVQDHTVTKIGFAGCNAALELRFPVTGGVFGIVYACQPETATSTRVYKVMARNDLDDSEMERCVTDEDAILLEDLAIMERYTAMTLDTDLTVEVHTKADRLSVAWRRLLKAMPSTAAVFRPAQ
jgi:phenylpropionate dioxygenase-like ring-hydroxylating dioxygenase large terminal subunit